MAALEQARNEAKRKQLYLERIVSANKPDSASEPKRARGILATVLGGLMLWGILSILIATFKDHMD
jgi:capsular polysaccharide transport system permease protein